MCATLSVPPRAALSSVSQGAKLKCAPWLCMVSDVESTAWCKCQAKCNDVAGLAVLYASISSRSSPPRLPQGAMLQCAYWPCMMVHAKHNCNIMPTPSSVHGDVAGMAVLYESLPPCCATAYASRCGAAVYTLTTHDFMICSWDACRPGDKLICFDGTSKRSTCQIQLHAMQRQYLCADVAGMEVLFAAAGHTPSEQVTLCATAYAAQCGADVCMQPISYHFFSVPPPPLPCLLIRFVKLIPMITATLQLAEEAHPYRLAADMFTEIMRLAAPRERTACDPFSAEVPFTEVNIQHQHFAVSRCDGNEALLTSAHVAECVIFDTNRNALAVLAAPRERTACDPFSAEVPFTEVRPRFATRQLLLR